jgi:hypothetical protein
MHKRNNKLAYYARILIFVSITLILYGAFLDLNSDVRLFDPVDDAVVINNGNESNVTITTVDGSEVTTTKDSNNDTDSSTYSNNTNNVVSTIPTLDDTNSTLRVNIENEYGITIYYGDETIGYSAGGISSNPINNSTTINAALTDLKNCLSLFPSGFFDEINKGGIPLTIYLINNYSNNNITGITDSDYSYAKISIAVSYPFEESFYHEIYHYIERYMFKKGANFNTWNLYNPVDFQYNTIDSKYSYSSTFSESAYFVNDYAQTEDTEDRASTFEYMMADSKALCLNNGMTVWKKAILMSRTIDAVFSTVSPNVVEYWERFL